MKKIKLISIITIMTLSIGLLQGCGGNKADKETQNKTKQVMNFAEDKEKKTDEDIPFKIDELEFVNPHFEIDSLGTCYFKTQIKNNSDYNIQCIRYTYEIDEAEKTYLWMYDGLAIDGTSSMCECFGVYSQNIEDMKLIEVQLNYMDKNNDVYNMIYNANLDLYRISE